MHGLKQNNRLLCGFIFYDQFDHDKYNFYNIELCHVGNCFKTIYTSCTSKPFYNYSKLRNKLMPVNGKSKYYLVQIYRHNARFKFYINFV